MTDIEPKMVTQSEIAKLKQQITDLTTENKTLKEKEKLYIDFGMNMYYYALERFDEVAIANMYNICTNCVKAHPGNDITNVIKCCLDKKESSRDYIYCRECWYRNKYAHDIENCYKCGAEFIKCVKCSKIQTNYSESLQCCFLDKLATGQIVKCHYCDKYCIAGKEECWNCYNYLCVCDICNKAYQTYEEETQCCQDIKQASDNFIECESCNVFNKKTTGDKLTCKYCEIEIPSSN
jgi:hypothetical protein